MAYSYPVATATSFISVCRALDLIFFVLVLSTLPTIYGGISKLICVTGRVVCSATINYLDRVHRRNKFEARAYFFSTTIVEPIRLFSIQINNETRERSCRQSLIIKQTTVFFRKVCG
jgi:hypothetical protein